MTPMYMLERGRQGQDLNRHSVLGFPVFPSATERGMLHCQKRRDGIFVVAVYAPVLSRRKILYI